MIIIIPLIIVIAVIAWWLRPRKGITRLRITSVMAAVIPVFLLFLAAIVFQLLHNAAGKEWVSDTANTLGIINAGLICVAILTAAGFGIARKSEIAKGLGFGICIDVFLFILEWGLLEWLGGV